MVPCDSPLAVYFDLSRRFLSMVKVNINFGIYLTYPIFLIYYGAVNTGTYSQTIGFGGLSHWCTYSNFNKSTFI